MKKLLFLAFCFFVLTPLTAEAEIEEISGGLVVGTRIYVSDYRDGNPDDEIVFTETHASGTTVEIRLPLGMLWGIYGPASGGDPLSKTSREIQTRLEGTSPFGSFFINTGGILRFFDLPALPSCSRPGWCVFYEINAWVDFTYFKDTRETGAINKVIFSLREGSWRSPDGVAPVEEMVEGEKRIYTGISLSELSEARPGHMAEFEDDPTLAPFGPRYKIYVPLQELWNGGLKIQDRIPTVAGFNEITKRACAGDINVHLIPASDPTGGVSSSTTLDLTITKITRVSSPMGDRVNLEGVVKYSYSKERGLFFTEVVMDTPLRAVYGACSDSPTPEDAPGDPGRLLPTPRSDGIRPASEGAVIDRSDPRLSDPSDAEVGTGPRGFLGGGGGWTCSMAPSHGPQAWDLGAALLVLFGLMGLGLKRKIN